MKEPKTIQGLLDTIDGLNTEIECLESIIESQQSVILRQEAAINISRDFFASVQKDIAELNEKV